MIISNSLYDNASFLKVVNELICFITCAHIGGLIQAEWHVSIDKKYRSEDWMKVNR